MQTSYSVSPPVAVAGMIADTRNYESQTGINAETSLALAPGLYVVRVVATQGVKAPAAAAAITGGLAGGFIIHQDLHINPLVVTNTDRALFQPKEPLGYMRRGVIWVQVEDAVTDGAAVFIRYTARLTNTTLGKARSDADTASSVDYAVALPGARFASSAGAGEFAKVRFNVSH